MPSLSYPAKQFSYRAFNAKTGLHVKAEGGNMPSQCHEAASENELHSGIMAVWPSPNSTVRFIQDTRTAIFAVLISASRPRPRAELQRDDRRTASTAPFPLTPLPGASTSTLRRKAERYKERMSTCRCLFALKG